MNTDLIGQHSRKIDVFFGSVPFQRINGLLKAYSGMGKAVGWNEFKREKFLGKKKLNPFFFWFSYKLSLGGYSISKMGVEMELA